MNTALRTLLVGLASFVVVGAVSFLVMRAIAPVESDPAALPEFDEAIPVVTAMPFEGDATEVATNFAEYQRESLETAHALGLPSNQTGSFTVVAAPIAGSTDDDASGSSGGQSGSTATSSSSSTDPSSGETSTTATGTTDTTDSVVDDGSEAGDTPTMPTPGGTPDADERMIDLCTESDLDGCPEGVSGTILAIRAIPELAGVTVFMPEGPDSARFVWDSRCEALPPEEGKAYFGIATNRPATITMRYRSLEWSRGAYAYPETTQTFTTSAEDEARWNSWLADDAALDADPRAWIHHCVTLELPARDDYVAWVSYEAKEDSSVTASNRRRVDFYVPGPGGLEPGAARRPTLVLPSGLDELWVSVTKEPDQRFETAAIPGTDPALCDIAGVEGSIGRSEGDVRGSRRSETTLDPALTQDPAYPYFPTYTVATGYQLQLQTGTDYVLCNYWLTPGPSFDVQQVVEIEAIQISTPEAFVPTVVLHGLTDIYRDPTSVRVSIPYCGSRTFDLSEDGAIIHDRTGARIASPLPETLCTVQSHLGEMARRGILVQSTVETAVGEIQSGSHYIRTPIECRPGPCNAVRLPEMAIVPLARIASDGSECPSDPFTGCISGDTHPAGRVIVELQFDSGGGNGAARWAIGEPTPYDDTPVPLPMNPQMDMDVSYAFAAGGPAAGAIATIDLVVDRPVEVTVTGIERIPGHEGSCDLPEPSLPSRILPFGTNTYRFSVTPLCLGGKYFVTVSAVDEDGNVGEFAGRIWGRSLDTPPDEAELFVPLAEIHTEMTVAINAPDNEHGHTVTVNPVRIASGDAFGPTATSLGWTWPTEARAAEARDGWALYGLDGRANACGEPGARELNVYARQSSFAIPLMSTAYVGVQDNDLSFVVQVNQNHTPGGPYGECAVGPLVSEQTLRRSVSFAELREGIELTSDDGTVVLTLRAHSFGDLGR